MVIKYSIMDTTFYKHIFLLLEEDITFLKILKKRTNL
nr:MAG TPA_asm: hypothetical protein [Caudoviricetes sp.]DAN90593.1 MAG TPA: hypothetical protein [Bacteriophage sp.]DAZ57118.1 MAG TPA: hypothetical protein [Caudoviricetes sp.]